MRKLQVFGLAILITLFSVAPVFAHEVGKADNSAQGLVKQGIAFLEGIQDAETARMDIQKATQAIGGDQLDQSKLNQALTLLQKPDPAKMEQAKVLLAEALGQNSQNTPELAYQPGYVSSSLNTALLVLAGAFAVLGAVIVGKVKASH